MRTIRASEICSFIFCQRAWWYQREGVEPANRTEMSAGSQFHEQQGNIARSAILLQIFAWILVILAVVGLAIYLTTQSFR
jgi:hypothetical protein